MNVLFHLICLINCMCMLIIGVHSKSKGDSDVKSIFPHRISSLIGQKFEVALNDTTFSVNISDKLENIESTEQSGNSVYNHVLGRNNDTDFIETDTWILIMYGSGDIYNASEHSCIGSRKSNIFINCNTDVHKPQLKYVGHSEHWKNNGCIYMFELTTCTICPSAPDEGLSRGSVFCIVVLTSVGVYLIIGICYRRLIIGAKGFEQIPHHKFWTRLGNLQADGCNFLCRHQEEETWQRLTSNAKDNPEQDDQDDALLHP